MEPRGNQEFLEVNATVAGDQLALSLNNKAAADILYKLPPCCSLDMKLGFTG